ncbi:MAG: transcriptional regulator [Candidatus Bathyarchaeota archaeon]|nr:transcriptional regulator [Candidatus Bathyarchaeota archaeon]
MTTGKPLGRNPTVLLEKIKENLEKLNDKMEVFIELQKQERKQDFVVQDLPEALDVMTLLSLPDHLRKTAVSICKLGHATAEEVAEQTKRARAVESGYLNQLVLMSYLKKERKGRKAYFFVEK